MSLSWPPTMGSRTGHPMWDLLLKHPTTTRNLSGAHGCGLGMPKPAGGGAGQNSEGENDLQWWEVL